MSNAEPAAITNASLTAAPIVKVLLPPFKGCNNTDVESVICKRPMLCAGTSVICTSPPTLITTIPVILLAGTPLTQLPAVLQDPEVPPCQV